MPRKTPEPPEGRKDAPSPPPEKKAAGEQRLEPSIRIKVPEGPGNLRGREEWFEKRSGRKE